MKSQPESDVFKKVHMGKQSVLLEYGVDLPIVESVYKVLFDGTDIKEALGTLFMRSVKKEF